ncbi:MAG: DNA repair protein RecO [Chlamydiales bacterium]|nr:DNA repair protein RecO [Chlamydiia bacterium]MCP5506992.1 DNA repair protein RecO [Chlamydiales bacterium]
MTKNAPVKRCEGVILQSFPYQEYDRILTAFSLEEGIVKFIVKGANREKKRGQAQTSPLSLVEFVYTTGQGELWQCKEITVKNMHLELRNSLASLEAGCDIAHALLSSQMIHKPAPKLYQLCTGYINRLSTAPNPQLLAASFRLKILRHDGLFSETPKCSICETPLTSWHSVGHDPFCADHAPLGAIAFVGVEKDLLQTLAFSRSYDEMFLFKMAEETRQKILRLFDEHLHH